MWMGRIVCHHPTSCSGECSNGQIVFGSLDGSLHSLNTWVKAKRLYAFKKMLLCGYPRWQTGAPGRARSGVGGQPKLFGLSFGDSLGNSASSLRRRR